MFAECKLCVERSTQMRCEKSADGVVGDRKLLKAGISKTRVSNRRLIEDGVAEKMKKRIPNVQAVFSV